MAFVVPESGGSAFTQTIDIEAKQRIHHKWRPRKTVILTDALKDLFPPGTRSVYGGLGTSQTRATGFFRTERDPSGRWWLVDPAGHPFISIGLNAIRPNKTKRGRAQMQTVWGNEQSWADRTAALMHEHGFNTVGAWSNFQAIHSGDQPVPYTDVLNFMARYSMKTGQSQQGTGHRDYPDDLIPVFDPEFEAYCHREAQKIQKLKCDPWLLGYFSDNEMPFPADALDRLLRRPTSDPGRVAAAEWLGNHQVAPDAITDEIRARFLYDMADRYFRISSEAIRANDPNHLYLGARFHAQVLWSEPVLRAAAKHADVISINWYAQWTPDIETMDKWLAWTDRPFLITEFFAKGMDSGLPNKSGAGWIVKTQRDRAAFYQNFTAPLIKHPGCVGWHWFRYMDNDPEDVPADPTNRDANKGIVDGAYKPYPDLIDAMNLLNHRVYQFRVRGLPGQK